MTPRTPRNTKPSLSFNHDRREVFFGGKERYLAPSEYAILKALYDTGKALTRADLARAMGHDEDSVETYAASRTVDQHLCRIRRKLGPGVIGTVTGFGYRYDGDKVNSHGR